jgi:hypothetical protein
MSKKRSLKEITPNEADHPEAKEESGKRKKLQQDPVEKEEDKEPANGRSRVELFLINPTSEISSSLNEFKDFEQMLRDIQK